MKIDFEFMTVEKDGKLATVTFRRPQLLNAFHYPAVVELDAVGRMLATDEDLRVVALVGEGRAFSTGIDLKDLSDGKIHDSYFHLWEVALRHFETMDKVVMCLMHGYAVGGGLQLGLACDLRVAPPSAKFSLPAIKEGLLPGLGIFRLARYIGLGRAKKLCLWGEFIDAEEGARIGLVDHLVSEETARAEFDALVKRMLAIASFGARNTKQALALAPDYDFDQAFAMYMEKQRAGMRDADFVEAISAYKEKRTPTYR
jgi:enoyl-CoA hydratase/carnithine racemase